MAVAIKDVRIDLRTSAHKKKILAQVTDVTGIYFTLVDTV